MELFKLVNLRAGVYVSNWIALINTQEEAVLEYWKRTNAFKEQLRRSEGRPEYVFYDGPPFATGLPHYGHILAGTIKDVVTRFACSTGHHVTRRFGWDCHGLPVEYEIDKKLGIKGKEDVLRLGIGKYNEVGNRCPSNLHFLSEGRDTCMLAEKESNRRHGVYKPCDATVTPKQGMSRHRNALLQGMGKNCVAHGSLD